MDDQCGKLVTVIGHQFITLTVDICVQHGKREALRDIASLSAAAEYCCTAVHQLTRFQLSTDGASRGSLQYRNFLSNKWNSVKVINFATWRIKVNCKSAVW